MKHILFLGLSIILTGCGQVTRSEVTREAAGTVYAGMPAQEALQRLKAKGFSCEPTGNGFTCTKDNNRTLIISCVERINLRIDRLSSKVIGIDVPEPACLGGFG